MRGKGLWLSLFVVLLLVACKGGDLPWSDDFSNPGTWLAESDARADVGVQDGMMRIFVAVPEQLAWTAAGRDLRDFSLTVEASQVAGPDDNEYGVLVRMQDNRNFYRFLISGDGYFLISKHVDGQTEPLGADWTPSTEINQGQATNTLQVICQGDTFTFLVNGQQLAEIVDDEFGHGDVGLYAGSFYEGEVEIHFDNLYVTQP